WSSGSAGQISSFASVRVSLVGCFIGTLCFDRDTSALYSWAKLQFTCMIQQTQSSFSGPRSNTANPALERSIEISGPAGKSCLYVVAHCFRIDVQLPWGAKAFRSFWRTWASFQSAHVGSRNH